MQDESESRTIGYNGWTNYETWCVNLWLSNDEGLYNEARDMAREYKDTESEYEWQTDKEAAEYAMAEALKEWADDLAEVIVPGSRSSASFVSDLIGAALSEVNWYEIAANWIADEVGVS